MIHLRLSVCYRQSLPKRSAHWQHPANASWYKADSCRLCTATSIVVRPGAVRQNPARLRRSIAEGWMPFRMAILDAILDGKTSAIGFSIGCMCIPISPWQVISVTYSRLRSHILCIPSIWLEPATPQWRPLCIFCITHLVHLICCIQPYCNHKLCMSERFS